MGVINRVNDIIQSNISAALDKAEDPEKLLNLLIQQMQDALVGCRATAATFLMQEKQLKRELAAKQLNSDAWQVKAEKALLKNRDDLAKAALLEKQRTTTQIQNQQVELTNVAESIEKLTADCQRLQNKLTEAKAKQLSYLRKEQVLQARVKVKQQLHSDKVADALARFEIIERRVESIESQVDAYDLTGSNSAHNTAEQIDELVKNSALEQELQALKSKRQELA
ncbi:MAG: PspA/IM30 family protein [Pseudoalteromonas sp.]|uniref:PspA/IM30 family protein n=1 Tax=unclassified Pseudoalteromonas TaxID=194690 RepID=UPI003F9C957E